MSLFYQENLFIEFHDCTQTLFIQSFTETVIYWNFTQALVFWKIMTLDAALSISCAVFVSASDRLLAKMSHFTLFAALFFLLAAGQKEEPVTWGQRSQRSHRYFDTWNAIWNIKPDVMFVSHFNLFLLFFYND